MVLFGCLSWPDQQVATETPGLMQTLCRDSTQQAPVAAATCLGSWTILMTLMTLAQLRVRHRMKKRTWTQGLMASTMGVTVRMERRDSNSISQQVGGSYHNGSPEDGM